MGDFLLAVWALKWHIVAAFTVVWLMTRLASPASRYARTQAAEPARMPTHGPWADHGPGCRCNVCR